MGKLDGKVVFISGAARGQGRSHAVRFAQEGADIIALDICAQIDTYDIPLATPEDLKETVRLVEATGRSIVAVEGDVRDLEVVEQTVAAGVDRFGRIDIAVANAGGVGRLRPGWEITADEFRDVVEVNLFGPWNVAKAVIGRMLAQGDGGAIVMTSSGVVNRPFANMVHYVAAKTGVIGLVRSLAYELAPHGICVNAVLPGMVNTPLVDNPVIRKLYVPDGDGPTDEEFRAVAGAMTPMPVPWLEPQDITEGILYLVSDSGRYVTGAELTLDAGTQLF